MDKCRLCLRNRKNLLLLSNAEDGITFLDMITYFTDIKIHKGDGSPDQICLSCRNKLRDAYNFKKDIERSETILNANTSSKRISFSNVTDIRTLIEIDCKPKIPLNYLPEDFIKDETDIFNYNDTVIKRMKSEEIKNQLTVNEFLDSVKMEDDGIDCDHDGDYKLEDNGHQSDSDYNIGKPLYKNKKPKKKKTKHQKIDPIKPVYLKDIIVKHSEPPRLDPNRPKKKYKYHGKTNICPYCGKLLLSKYIDTHILVHTTERNFKCDICSKAFLSEKSLNHHMKVHTDKGKHKCSLCVATFSCLTSLRSHMLVHNDERNHICNVCNKAFKRRYALSRHLVVHNFGKKSIQCELCPMTFSTKYFLRHHMRVHTGERPYRCDLCSQPYSYKHDFNRHCLKKHGIFMKRRLINVMNEKVLQEERCLMRDLTLRAHGIIKDDEIPSVFQGAQGALAYNLVMKAIAAGQVPANYVC